MLERTWRWVLVSVGLASLVTGFVGVFVPLLPTTPFLLVSAWCFARSSERLHAWLLTRSFARGFLSDWERHGAISRRAKVLCVVMLALGLSYPIAFRELHVAMKVALAMLGLGVGTWVVTRPTAPRRTG